jgi:hypothetical protein
MTRSQGFRLSISFHHFASASRALRHNHHIIPIATIGSDSPYLLDFLVISFVIQGLRGKRIIKLCEILELLVSFLIVNLHVWVCLIIQRARKPCKAKEIQRNSKGYRHQATGNCQVFKDLRQLSGRTETW